MALSHSWFVAVQTYLCWHCPWNPFAKLTLIYASEDSSSGIQNGLPAVRWFYGAPECWYPATTLLTWPSGWSIALWTAYGLSKGCYGSLPPNLIHHVVLVSNTPGGGFNVRIGPMEPTLHTLVFSYVYRPVSLFFSSRLHLNKCFTQYASGTGCDSFNLLE
jgi:hypothetical protein